MVRAPDLKSGVLKFKFHPDHQLDMFLVAPGSTPRLRLYIVNWSASYLLSLFQWFISLALKSPTRERSIKCTIIHIRVSG